MSDRPVKAETYDDYDGSARIAVNVDAEAEEAVPRSLSVKSEPHDQLDDDAMERLAADIISSAENADVKALKAVVNEADTSTAKKAGITRPCASSDDIPWHSLFAKPLSETAPLTDIKQPPKLKATSAISSDVLPKERVHTGVRKRRQLANEELPEAGAKFHYSCGSLPPGIQATADCEGYEMHYNSTYLSPVRGSTCHGNTYWTCRYYQCPARAIASRGSMKLRESVPHSHPTGVPPEEATADRPYVKPAKRVKKALAENGNSEVQESETDNVMKSCKWGSCKDTFSDGCVMPLQWADCADTTFFSVTDRMRAHVKAHVFGKRAPKLLHCMHTNCEASFTSQTELTKHLKDHLKADKHYECSNCQQKFSTRPDLNAHKGAVHFQKIHDFDFLDDQ